MFDVQHVIHIFEVPTIFPNGATVEEVHVCRGDLQATIDDLLQGHKFTFLSQDQFLLIPVNFCCWAKKIVFNSGVTIVSHHQMFIVQKK